MRASYRIALGFAGCLTAFGCRPASTDAPAVDEATPASAEVPAEGPTLVIRGAQVFDGERSLGTPTVLVRGGQIVALGEAIEVPPGATEIDGRGHTLVPGLIDAHTHIWQRTHLEEALVFGVTTELDMMSAPAGLAVLKKRQRGGKDDDIADLRTAGHALTAEGGHGTEYGFEVPTVAAPGEVEAFVEARVSEGSDYLKIIYDDLAALGRPSPSIAKATLDAAIRAAHARELLAVVHITTLAQAEDAIAGGADGLAHVFVDALPSEALVKGATESGAFVADTLPVIHAQCGRERSAALAEDPRLRPFLSPAQRRTLTGMAAPAGGGLSCETARGAVAALHGAGVPILASTDAPNPGTVHGASLHHDLELLVESGLSPQEALVAATAAPARAFGLEDRGRIVAGRRADLLLVRGDPLADITTTRDIARVWKRGVELDREAVAQRISTEIAAIEAARSAPPPPGSESGAISDFDDGTQGSVFGAGWQPATDASMGGGSTVALSVVKGGAERSRQTLEIRGVIDEASLPRAWSGAMFFPGAGPMEPANLTAWETLSFSAKGDVATMRVMLFSQQQGSMPSIREVELGKKWSRHELRLADFGVDPYDITAIFFGLPAVAGEGVLHIDQVRLDPKG